MMRNLISGCFSLRAATSVGASVLLAGVLPLSAASFSKVEVPRLPGIISLTSGALARGDHDNDKQLDFLATGNNASELWRNTGPSTNALLRLPPGSCFVSVHAVDAALAGGPFSIETAFSTLPALSIGKQGADLVLTWTTPDTGYELESNDTLAPADWMSGPSGASSPLLLNPDQSPRYFRLGKP